MSRPDHILVETERAFDMIHRDAVGHIATMKDRQWKITHYAVGLLVGLFYVSTTRAMTEPAGVTLLSIAVVGIWTFWLILTYTGARPRQRKGSG